MPKSTRNGLGEFLRSRREKLSPKAVGLPDRRRRRTPGLRREEVAELAGIGVDWYIRLEQGRAVSPRPPRWMRWPAFCAWTRPRRTTCGSWRAAPAAGPSSGSRCPRPSGT
ncbi:helix-turn-helix domain-containing protein [Streptomyces sp. NPDC048644]|uniref:helix-turn-helix domain-containing protein n=1 Tax=Streptomyces sp. NPDC048644 TaxID=3365582 RepID=UPI0037128EBC